MRLTVKNIFEMTEEPQKNKAPRGVNKEKLAKLKLALLLPLIPPNRHAFWKSLHYSSSSVNELNGWKA